MGFDPSENVQAMGMLALGGIIIIGLLLGGFIRFRFGKTELAIGNMKDKVDSAERQLNGRPEGSTTVSADVAYLRKTMEKIVDRLDETSGVLEEVRTTAGAAAADAAVVKSLVFAQGAESVRHESRLAKLEGAVEQITRNG